MDDPRMQPAHGATGSFPGGDRTGGRLAAGRGTRDAEADYADFFENGTIALHMVGADGTILHANRAELEMLGYAAEDYIGRHISEFHADRETIDDILSRLTAGERLDRYPARLRARDGSIRRVEITSSAHCRDGAFVNTRCFTIDRTDYYNARKEADSTQERLRQVLDALPAGVYMTDADGALTYYNRAAAELVGREPQLGQDLWCVALRLKTAEGEDLPLDRCPMAIALKENRPVRGVEALAQRPDGTLVPIMPFPTPLRDEEGRLIGAVNMLVDVSERKEAEMHQRMLVDELNHRVKNNMQMLYGLLAASMRETQSAEARSVLGAACKRVGAMAAAQQLLYRGTRAESFAIGEFLHTVCGYARQSVDCDIVLDIDAEDVRLPNDCSIPLALILNELLTNAAKYGRNGRRRSRATVSLRQDDHHLVLSVADEGPGFTPRDEGLGSSGLGILRGLSRQLGGEFLVENRGGARCVVRFPKTAV